MDFLWAALGYSLYGCVELDNPRRKGFGQPFSKELCSLKYTQVLTSSFAVTAHSKKSASRLAVVEEEQGREIRRVYSQHGTGPDCCGSKCSLVSASRNQVRLKRQRIKIFVLRPPCIQSLAVCFDDQVADIRKVLSCCRIKLVKESAQIWTRFNLNPVSPTHIRQFAIREHATLPVKSLEDTVALSVLLNELCIEPLRQSVDP